MSQDASPVGRRGLRAPGKAPEVPPVAPEGDTHGRLGTADGEVPEGVTAFGDYPAVDNLDPALLRALRDASARARADRVEVYVTSGWRSRAYQERLLDDAVARYGSRAEAARWVSTPATSAHVSGHAVDVGRSDAAAWLADHGAQFGLCQVYDNEPWHYELRPDAARDGCPTRYADPTQDPRNRR
jgi:LAS superfamily LD-carboxypeptidase LdcB